MNTAPAYGWSTVQPPHNLAYLLPPLFRLLRKYDAKRVIDIGCGNGVTVKTLSTAGYAAVGCEPDRDGYEIARAHAAPAPVYNLGVYDDPTPMGCGQFDTAMSFEVVEHLFDPGKLFGFARQLLVPGGTLMISTPYHGYAKNLAISLCGRWDFHFKPHHVGGHIKFWSRETLTRMFEKNGFEMVDFVGAGRVPYLWKSMILVGRSRS